MDAVYMYTNIYLGHALPRIVSFFTENPVGVDIAIKSKLRLNPLVYALDLVMKSNVFQFGDTYFLQKPGTAMGTPAPTYSTVYFGIHEAEIIPKCPQLDFYGRYIDNGFGIWKILLQGDENIERKKEFMKEINEFGANNKFFRDNPHFKPLTWEFSEFGNEQIFLDLRIKLKGKKIETSIYEKDLNLHLYLPPTSCHPP